MVNIKRYNKIIFIALAILSLGCLIFSGCESKGHINENLKINSVSNLECKDENGYYTGSLMCNVENLSEKITYEYIEVRIALYYQDKQANTYTYLTEAEGYINALGTKGNTDCKLTIKKLKVQKNSSGQVLTPNYRVVLQLSGVPKDMFVM